MPPRTRARVCGAWCSQASRRSGNTVASHSTSVNQRCPHAWSVVTAQSRLIPRTGWCAATIKPVRDAAQGRRAAAVSHTSPTTASASCTMVGKSTIAGIATVSYTQQGHAMFWMVPLFYVEQLTLQNLSKKTTLAQAMLAELQQLLPPGFQVYVLFDSWYAATRLLKFCRRQGWQVVCAIKSNRKLDDQKLSQWSQALRHQRYQRVQLTATDGRQRSYLVRPRQGRLTHLSFDVCVLISKRHPRDKHPKYFLCTDLSLSAQQILSIYQKRWPVEVDNFYVKQHLGLADFRVQSYEATEKWFAIVFLAFVFLQWRLNHARGKERMHSLADVVRQHRYEHAVPCWRRPARKLPN
jgi:hypothetical protein